MIEEVLLSKGLKGRDYILVYITAAATMQCVSFGFPQFCYVKASEEAHKTVLPAAAFVSGYTRTQLG